MAQSNLLVFIKCINSESAVQFLSSSVASVLPHMQPRFLISREEIQLEDCFDIIGQSPGKPFCSATRGLLDSERRLLSSNTLFDHGSEKSSD